MIRLITLVCLIAIAFAKSPSINKDLIVEINDNLNGWTAAPSPFISKFQSLEAVKEILCSARPQVQFTERRNSEPTFALPTSFESATEWNNCSSIKKINNQARCGSCWAFGGVESITDRFCIAQNQQDDVQLSFEDVTSCDQEADGCQGGAPGSAYEYAQNQGIVTAACSPYTVPTCPPEKQPCMPNTFVQTPPCVKTCKNGQSWSASKHFVSNSYSVGPSPTAIQAEIQKNGPVEACFSVYEDFLHYKSGVYKRSGNQYLGGHCIKIVGWGVLGGEDYWEVANSWTTTWGDKGFFKILRGVDECGIESAVTAGTPKIN